MLHYCAANSGTTAGMRLSGSLAAEETHKFHKGACS